MNQSQREQINKLFLSPEKFIKEHGELQVIQGAESPQTTIFKSFDNKLVRRIVFDNEDDFRQWLPCLKFEILRQNDIADLYPDHVLRIMDYSYEGLRCDFKFYITYDCNPDNVKPLIYHNHRNDSQLIKDVLNILELGIIIRNTGVCHGNIKPSNLFVCRNQNSGSKILLTDFGSMRTHSRNFFTQYQSQEEQNWQANLQFYYQKVNYNKKQNDQSTLKLSNIDADIWALGIIILEMLNGRAEQRKPLLQNQLQNKIQLLRTISGRGSIADALDSLLLNNGDVKKVHWKLHQSQSKKKLPENFLYCSKRFAYDQSLFYTSKLETIKDSDTIIEKLTQLIEPPPRFFRCGTSDLSRAAPSKDLNQLVRQITQSSEISPGRDPEEQPSLDIIHFNKLNQSLTMSDRSEQSQNYGNENYQQMVEEKLKKFLINQNTDDLLTVKEFQTIESIPDKERYLAELFSKSMVRAEDRSDIQYLSSLNYILEHTYEDINMSQYKFTLLESEDEDKLNKSVPISEWNIPLRYLPYLKKFTHEIVEVTFRGFLLNGQPHGLGKFENEKISFQGIFHQGKYLWGTLYETKLENKEIRMYKTTGPFNQETQKIHGEDCEFKVFDNKLKELEHYKGRMTNSKPEGKGIKISKQFNWKYIGEWVDGSMQGQGTLEQNGQVKYIGNYECGEQTGYGIKFYDKSNFQQGCFKNGQPQGIYIEKSYNIISKKKNHDCNIF